MGMDSVVRLVPVVKMQTLLGAEMGEFVILFLMPDCSTTQIVP